MRPFSPILYVFAIVIVVLLATTEASDVRVVQRAQLVGGAVNRNGNRHLRTRQEQQNMGNSRQTGAEYITGRRVGKTLHTDLHNEQHQNKEGSRTA